MTYKDAIEILKEYWSGRKDKPNYPDFDDVNEALYTLEQELTEKDKEIERLKSCVISKEQVEEIAKQEIKTLTKSIYETCRHQVCEEIRRKIANIENIDLSRYMSLCEILDQIEKGE